MPGVDPSDTTVGVDDLGAAKSTPTPLPPEEAAKKVDQGPEPLTPEQIAAKAQNQLIRDFIDDALFKQINWAAFLRELMNYLEFGYSVFEICLKVEDFRGQPLITLNKMASRKHRTIYAWEMMNENAPGITQWTIQKGTVFIPANKLCIFTNYKEGDNFEGISMLRTAYRHYYAKKNVYQLQLVAAERMSLGIPHMTYEPSVSPADRAVAREMLRDMRNNEEAYLETVAGIDVEMMDMGSKGVYDLNKIIDHHDRQISKNVLAQFIEMGAGMNTSAFSTGASQAQLFNRGVEAVAKNIADTLTDSVIDLLVQLNWPGAASPKLIVEDINDEDMKTYGTTLQLLAQAGLITPGAETEKYIRGKLSLPEISTNVEQTYEATEKLNLKNALLGQVPQKSNPSSADPSMSMPDASSPDSGGVPDAGGGDSAGSAAGGDDSAGSSSFSEKDLLRRAKYVRDELLERYKL